MWTGNFSTSIKHIAPHELMIMRGGGGGGGGKYLYYNICYLLDTLGFLCCAPVKPTLG